MWKRNQRETICRLAGLVLLAVIVICGSAGSMAQGSRGNAAGEVREAEGKRDKEKDEKNGKSVKSGKSGKSEKSEKEEMEEPEFLKEGQSYAYVELKHGVSPVLLVTDGTYGYNGLEASFNSVVYGQDEEGNWQKMQVIAGSGTAYPIRYDKGGIYVTGGHFAAYYSMDWENMELVQEEYAAETFDENGNVAYFYAADGKTERSVEDNRYLVALYDRYEKAELVNFRKREGIV